MYIYNIICTCVHILIYILYTCFLKWSMCLLIGIICFVFFTNKRMVIGIVLLFLPAMSNSLPRASASTAQSWRDHGHATSNSDRVDPWKTVVQAWKWWFNNETWKYSNEQWRVNYQKWWLEDKNWRLNPGKAFSRLKNPLVIQLASDNCQSEDIGISTGHLQWESTYNSLAIAAR